MGTAVIIIVMGILCALSVPAITSNRERLEGSKTSTPRKVDNSSALKDNAIFMFCFWVLGVIILLVT